MSGSERKTPKKPQPRYILGMHDDIEFGKYRGETVADVIDNDPGYVTWCAEAGVVQWEDEVLELVARKAETKARFKARREGQTTQ